MPVVRRCRWFLLLCAVLSAATLSAQPRSAVPEVTLAEVGGKSVTARDLIERIELMPWLGKDRFGALDSAKVKALQSLVAERILSLEALAEGIGTDSASRHAEQKIEKLMVRDELYKRQVTPRVTVSDQEATEGLKRFAWQVRALMITARSRTAAQAVAGALRARGRLDSVLAHPPGGERLTVDTVSATFGTLEQKQEDLLYALTPARPVSDPQEIKRLGWVVLLYLDRRTNPDYAKLSIPDRLRTARERARQRREIEVATRYYASILSPQRAEAQEAPFELLARTLQELFVSAPDRYRNEQGYRLDMVAGDAKQKLGSQLDDVLVTTNGAGITMGEVLDGFELFNFLIPRLAPQEFKARLSACIQEVVARELMAREGYRQQLQHTEAVRHDVDTWANNWRATALERKITREHAVTVTDDEVMDRLLRQPNLVGNAYQVNVREILLDSLRTALDVMERIIAGADMKSLARQLSRRKEWAARGGESGYFPAGQHPRLAVYALAADSGKLIGPLVLQEGYSVLTVLGKRQPGGEHAVSFDSLRALLRAELLAEKARRLVNERVAAAAGNYRVKLYYDRLQQVQIMPSNMVTRRMIGFGGTILAAPTLFPLWEWVGMTREIKEVFP